MIFRHRLTLSAASDDDHARTDTDWLIQSGGTAESDKKNEMFKLTVFPVFI